MLVQAEIETLRPNQGEHPLPSTPQPNPCINMQSHPSQSKPIHQKAQTFETIFNTLPVCSQASQSQFTNLPYPKDFKPLPGQ